MSKKYSINKKDLESVAITLLLAALSAAVSKLIELAPGFDLGNSTTTLIVLTALKLLQKYLGGK